MIRFFFLFLTAIITPVLNSGENNSNFWRKIGSAAYAPISAVKSHFERYGAGKQAIQEVNNCFDIIKKQNEAMAKIANNNNNIKLAEQALERVAESNLNLVNVHAKRNDILGGALQFGQVVGTACSFVYIGKASYDLGHWVYRYFWPSQESIVRKKLVDQEIKTINTRAALNKCLSNNLMMERNAFSVPIKCEDEARLFLEVAGIKEYNKVVKALKKNQEI